MCWRRWAGCTTGSSPMVARKHSSGSRPPWRWGSKGRIARRLLDEARTLELELDEASSGFARPRSGFLHDPTLARPVRQALIEELGRFQDFSRS